MINGLDGPKRGTGLIHGVTNSGPTLWTTYENISAGWEELFSGVAKPLPAFGSKLTGVCFHFRGLGCDGLGPTQDTPQ